MPYIPDLVRRKVLREGDLPRNMAELTYILNWQARRYWEQHKDKGFQTIGEIYGAFDSANDEFKETVGRPYEAKKRVLNGDVYTENGEVL